MRTLPSLSFTLSNTLFAALRSVRSTKTPLTEPLSTAPTRAFETWSISRPMAAISTFAIDVPGFCEIASSLFASGDSSVFIASIAAALSCIASAFCGRSLESFVPSIALTSGSAASPFSARPANSQTSVCISQKRRSHWNMDSSRTLAAGPAGRLLAASRRRSDSFACASRAFLIATPAGFVMSQLNLPPSATVARASWRPV